MNVNGVWEKACGLLKQTMTSVAYDTWIASALRPLDLSGDRFFVSAVSDFYHQFVVPRYSTTIAGALSEATGQNIKLTILTPRQTEEFRAGENPAQKPSAKLNPKYLFDTFVIGASNRFAHAASLAVAEAPASAYNPLFLYGGVGLGKTHLMHAIGHYILQQKPSTRLEYVTSETFTIELVSAIQTNKNAAFRDKYRNVDVLLIDDIQFIAGRDSTQEEFFHTFNALHGAGKQIIISSDRPPKEIAKLEERLRSRFEWGLIADIQKPDLDTRYAILRKKADADRMTVDEKVLSLIAQNVSSNIRELEGCLTRLSAYASLTGKEMTPSLAEEALREVFSAESPRSVAPEDVLKAVGTYYALSLDELTGPRRHRNITVPRQLVMYLARQLTQASLPQIGQVLGGRDHTTVLNGCSRINQLKQDNSAIRTAIDELSRQLTGQ